VTITEDRIRDTFATFVIPDLPVPAIQSLQRRARRHRLNQAGGALGSAAVVVMCIFGGMSFSGGGGSATAQATGVQRIPAHIEGGGAQQWLVSKQTVDGQVYSSATYLSDGTPCTVSTAGGNPWCQPERWPRGEVADATPNSEYSGQQQIVQVLGRVPTEARTVAVNVDGASTTVPAVETPTSTTERFFAAYLNVPAGYNVDETPILGVFNAAGDPVAAPHPQNDVITNTSPIVSHVAGLPSNQRVFSSMIAEVQAIEYRHGGVPCVALAFRGALLGHTCAATAPLAGRPLLSVRIPHWGQIVIGDAPNWANLVRLDGPQSVDDVSLDRMPGISDRTFWLTQLSGPNTKVIATCTVGDNCTVVQPYDSPSSAG
jgi:hypothetical protein